MKQHVLIVTATQVESRAVLQAFAPAVAQELTPQALSDRLYFNLGMVNGARVFLTQSEMGSGGLDASLPKPISHE
jgi:nucleoside phosphorylase